MKDSTATEKSDTDAPLIEQGVENLPEMNYFVDKPYVTKDMFSTSSQNGTPDLVDPLETQLLDANISDCNDLKANTPEELPVANLGKGVDKKGNIIGFPVEELARELVTLIEDRVSLRSGEQLDDVLRDDLTQAVTAQLEGWLKYE